MRLIDADALIRDIEHYNLSDGKFQHWVEIQPTIEPEQSIIRCKDCKHIQKWRSEESAKKFGQIYECARGVFGCPKPEDFCSWAERRGEQE